MKIILGEDRGGKLLNERAFTSETVLVGRDPAICHFFFEQSKWPMVSRRHAEFHLAGGNWMVSDAGSRFGTFVNGQKIDRATNLSVGSHVQLGPEGPILRVIAIEQARESKPEPKATEIDRAPTVHDAPPAAPVVSKSTPPLPRPVSPAYLELVDPESGTARRFELNKDLIRLGRDPEGDVVIDAAAAVVSRRHAEIRRADNQFAVVDLKSFNGTLVNAQRIAGPTSLFDRDQIQLGTGGPLLRVMDPSHPAPVRGVEAAARATPQSIPSEFGQIAAMARRQTIVSSSGSLPRSEERRVGKECRSRWSPYH